MKKSETDKCDCNVIHKDTIKKVSRMMPKEEYLLDLADLFKVFGDSTRVKILCALQKSEMCVCDISYLLGMTKSAISHQLKTLRQSRLIKNRKEGKVVYYSLADDHVKTIFSDGLKHIRE